MKWRKDRDGPRSGLLKSDDLDVWGEFLGLEGLRAVGGFLALLLSRWLGWRQKSAGGSIPGVLAALRWPGVDAARGM